MLKKIILTTTIVVSSLFAVDYSNMSTENMMNMRGNVDPSERDAFRNEMQKRVGAMSEEDRKAFMKNKGEGRGMQGGGSGGMNKGSGNKQRNRKGEI